MIVRRGTRGRSRTKRRRFRFSLNGLAIQLSALALSFTLVALLVVSGSHSAFVQQSESVTKAQALAKERARLRHEQELRDRLSQHQTAPTAGPSPSAVPAVVTEAPQPTPVVELTDSAAGTAMFGGETLAPGLAVERCIDVSYVGDVVPGPVVLYAAETSGDLAPYLDLTVELGDAGAGVPGTCDAFTPTATLFQGTLASFASSYSSYATGRATWNPSDTDTTRRFRFVLAVRDDPAAAGRSAGFGFSWRTEVP